MAEQPSHWVPVNMRDGIPYCPCHDEPMAKVGDGGVLWRCQLGLLVEQLLEQRLGELMADPDPWEGP
jgi:hypothetical protein